jgi:uncharacterized protein (TIGR02996 family)
MDAREAALLEEVAASPDDDGPLLVYADWLTSTERWRGELIVLDHMDRAVPGGLCDVVRLRRLLVLAAREGFPRFTDPDLALRGVTQRYSRYEAMREGVAYSVGYIPGTVDVEVEDHTRRTREHAQLRFDGGHPTCLLEEELNVILHAIDGAIRDGAPLRKIALPAGDALRAHPHYRLGPLPRYALPAEVTHGQEITLSARDHARWQALYRRFLTLSGARTLAAG